MTGTEKLIGGIKEALAAVHEELTEKEQGNKVWTKSVKTALVDLAGSNPHRGDFRYVCASGVDIEKVDGKKVFGEWLYDVCWLDYESAADDAPVLRMPLAVECEWGTDQDIIEDFQKLILSRAALRVMVFERQNNDTRETVRILKSHVKTFRDGQKGDRYLLAGHDGPGKGFVFKVLTGDGGVVDS